MRTTPFTIRNFLSLPLVGLALCLLAIIVIAQLGKAPVSSPSATPAGSASEQLENAVSLTIELEKTRDKLAAGLRQLETRLSALATDAPIAGARRSESSTASGLRRAAQQVALGMLLNVQEGWNGVPLEERVNEFQTLLQTYRPRVSTARETALLEEIRGRFVQITRLGRELGAVAARRDATLEHATRISTEDRAAALSIATPAYRTARARVEPRAVIPPLASRWMITLLACGGLLCAIAAVVRTSQRIAQPVSHLVETARAITSGKERKRASLRAAGDLRDLAEAFNQMIEARQQAEERLKASHEKLELRVSARTAELWHANVALREESEQRGRAQREFHQAQKMDALGKLAGAIAHDFNNLLTVIIGGAECVRKQLGPDHPVVPMLQTVEKAGERAAGLTRPLLTFSRTQVLTLENLNLNEAAQEAERMLHRLVGINIDLQLDLASDLRPIRANANQVQQVLLNLGVNARDAMGGIGHLTITTRNATFSQEQCAQHGVEASEHWVEVEVEDTGSGMDAETKARIFEPFFTTKAEGKGTGLGLSTVFGIVRQSGGFLEVESAPGEGTAFRAFFPVSAAPEPAAVLAAPITTEQQLVPANQTVLLVDDEDDIRELATLTLQERGYRILSAPNAQEAIVLAEKHVGEISALVTDVIMPGMTGVQLAGVLGRMIPQLRVLFVSGHSNETITEQTLSETHASYLQKPYFGNALAEKLSEVLATPRPMTASAA